MMSNADIALQQHKRLVSMWMLLLLVDAVLFFFLFIE